MATCPIIIYNPKSSSFSKKRGKSGAKSLRMVFNMFMTLHAGLKFLVTSLIIFASIIFIEVVFVSILAQALPNHVELTFIKNFGFYMDLLHSNHAATLKLILMQNPVFIIQKINTQTSSQVWGLYLMPISIFLQLAVSMFIVVIKKSKPSLQIWSWTLIATSILLFAIFYLRLEVCCTSGPAWLLNAILLYRVYTPSLSTIFWQDIYIQISPWLIFTQFFIATVAISILAMCFNTSSYSRKND